MYLKILVRRRVPPNLFWGAKQEQTVAVAFQLPFLPVAVQLEQLTIVGGAVQTCN